MSTPDDARAYPRRSNAASRRSTIVSWNVGLRGLRALTDARAAQKTNGRADTHGVRRIHGYGSMKALFDALGSDLKVICLQETKLSSSGDVERLERVEGWDGAHAVCESSNHRVGYSGVAVYSLRLDVIGYWTACSLPSGCVCCGPRRLLVGYLTFPRAPKHRRTPSTTCNTRNTRTKGLDAPAHPRTRTKREPRTAFKHKDAKRVGYLTLYRYNL